jgi:hypothetical protein
MKAMKNVLLIALTAGVLAFAHHGLAEFDQTKKVNLQGTVTEFHFVNPHCMVEFDVKDDKGQVRHWQGEMTSPVHLKGWTATTLEPGNTVTVSGFPAKNGTPFMWLTKLNSNTGVELKSFSDK